MALLLALPGAAHAGSVAEFDFAGPGRVVRVTQVGVRVEGRLAVDFRGTPGACARLDACDTSGRIVLELGQTATITLGDVDVNGRRRTLGFLTVDDDSARTTVQLRRGLGATCADARVGEPFFANLPAVGRGRMRLSPLATGGDAPDPLSNRCGGPLASDLTRDIPAPVVSISRLRRGAHSLDLSGSGTFAAGGLSGTVRSSLILRLGPRQIDEGNDAADDPPSEPRLREVTALFRVARVDGRLGASFTGLPDPTRCEPLDACNTAGLLETAPSPRARVAVSASALASVPSRAVRAAIGLAPGPASRLVTVEVNGTWPGTTVTQSLTRGDGGTCRDSARTLGGYLAGEARGRRAHVQLVGPLPRTRCPGPTSGDVRAPLASGSLDVRSLGARRVVLRLTRGRQFVGEAHRGQTTADLAIVLHRTSVRERTLGQDLPPSG